MFVVKANAHAKKGISRLKLLFVASLALCSTAVASAQAPTPEPVPPPLTADYIIGPGDSLQIFVWRNPELSTSVPVRPDGKISTPLVEDMTAAGKTPAQLAREMESVLAEYVRSPTVNVIVVTAASTMSKVQVFGQVKVPQAVPYRDGLRVLDVMLLTGGVTDFAAPNRAKIVRAAVNGQKGKEEPVRLRDLLEKGDMKQNLLLMPGDILVVPQARF